MKSALLGIAAAAVLTMGSAQAATATRSSFGALSDGTKVEAVTLTNGAGMSAKIMTLGATLQSLIVPDRAAARTMWCWAMTRRRNISPGPTISASRWAVTPTASPRRKFSLDGKTYTLAANDGPNSLHGGPQAASTSGCGRSTRPQAAPTPRW